MVAQITRVVHDFGDGGGPSPRWVVRWWPDSDGYSESVKQTPGEALRFVERLADNEERSA